MSLHSQSDPDRARASVDARPQSPGVLGEIPLNRLPEGPMPPDTAA
jgi:hypothetical protein